MKRKNQVIGDILIGLGLIIMVGGVGYSVIAQFTGLKLPELLSHGAIMSIFVGAILWLAGARIGGREEITDRYWWAKHSCENRRHRHP